VGPGEPLVSARRRRRSSSTPVELPPPAQTKDRIYSFPTHRPLILRHPLLRFRYSSLRCAALPLAIFVRARFPLEVRAVGLVRWPLAFGSTCGYAPLSLASFRINPGEGFKQGGWVTSVNGQYTRRHDGEYDS
jgi:hypothetical protein